jgi:hypothetical protein
MLLIFKYRAFFYAFFKEIWIRAKFLGFGLLFFNRSFVIWLYTISTLLLPPLEEAWDAASIQKPSAFFLLSSDKKIFRLDLFKTNDVPI